MSVAPAKIATRRRPRGIHPKDDSIVVFFATKRSQRCTVKE